MLFCNMAIRITLYVYKLYFTNMYLYKFKIIDEEFAINLHQCMIEIKFLKLITAHTLEYHSDFFVDMCHNIIFFFCINTDNFFEM